MVAFECGRKGGYNRSGAFNILYLHDFISSFTVPEDPKLKFWFLKNGTVSRIPTSKLSFANFIRRRVDI
jgi:hypothetical protein